MKRKGINELSESSVSDKNKILLINLARKEAKTEYFTCMKSEPQSYPKPEKLEGLGQTADRSGEACNKEVTIANFLFVPKEVQIKVHSEVTWRVGENVPKYSSGIYDSNERSFYLCIEELDIYSQGIKKGEEFRCKFSTPGTYRVTCGNYSKMEGLIKVIDNDSENSGKLSQAHLIIGDGSKNIECLGVKFQTATVRKPKQADRHSDGSFALNEFKPPESVIALGDKERGETAPVLQQEVFSLVTEPEDKEQGDYISDLFESDEDYVKARDRLMIPRGENSRTEEDLGLIARQPKLSPWKLNNELNIINENWDTTLSASERLDSGMLEIGYCTAPDLQSNWLTAISSDPKASRKEANNLKTLEINDKKEDESAPTLFNIQLSPSEQTGKPEWGPEKNQTMEDRFDEPDSVNAIPGNESANSRSTQGRVDSIEVTTELSARGKQNIKDFSAKINGNPTDAPLDLHTSREALENHAEVQNSNAAKTKVKIRLKQNKRKKKPSRAKIINDFLTEELDKSVEVLTTKNTEEEAQIFQENSSKKSKSSVCADEVKELRDFKEGQEDEAEWIPCHKESLLKLLLAAASKLAPQPDFEALSESISQFEEEEKILELDQQMDFMRNRFELENFFIEINNLEKN